MSAGVLFVVAAGAPLVGRAEVPDYRTTNEYEQVIEASRPLVSRCTNGAPGRIDVRFTVAANGTTGDVTISTNTYSGPGIERCVVGVVRGLRFRAVPGEPVSLHVPYRFAGPSDAGADASRDGP